MPRGLDEVGAVIFDMDGVVTDTAAVHAAAWKLLFDAYLESRAQRTGQPFVPFDIETDYARYVDGKARLDGVRGFLASRGINLPAGAPSDPPDRETVAGLGNRKNAAFLERLRSEGAHPFASTVALARRLRASGVRVGVISASRNMGEVLAAARLETLFDVRVDGNDAAELGLPGKPDPAIFLEAARRLGIEPANAAIVEDSLAGVAAGREGGFALVIGVDRLGQADALLEAGADLVVPDLGELPLAGLPASIERLPTIPELPSALDPGVLDRYLRGRRPVVFLDYDGTLTPIVPDPAQAVLPAANRDLLLQLAAATPVAIISGRDLADVRGLVGVDGIWYAGSHGFDVVSPDGARHQEAPGSTALLDGPDVELRAELGGVPGARVERKGFAIAVHFRATPDDRVPDVAAVVERVAARHTGLRVTGGKRVLELRPSVAWDKGRAVIRLLELMGESGDDVVPVYVGDDLTDEDAFEALRDQGLGVAVRGENDERASAAHVSLASPSEVPELLARLAAAAADAA
jgi:trehalose-phosphatase